MKDKRFEIYDEKGNLIGVDYTLENGYWMHKWYFKGKYERGSWRGRAKGENMEKWTYKEIESLN